ncbi:MAG: CGGC domain-containing protein [Proteobacteria bacterium]|nr:CGGC domain-containing protein [Pseudomonadota bacterium]
MTKIGIIRCEKNETTCPLTGCITCLEQRTQGFKSYDAATLAGIFTCRCPGDNVVNLAKILKAKGAEVIHVATCLFANKVDGKWVLEGDGFCEKHEQLLSQMREATGIPCIKGTAHLPEGYSPEI